MARKNYNYPIMLGPDHRKGIAAGPSQFFGKGADLFVIRLNKDLRTGDTFYPEDIENVETVIHFCDKRSVKLTVDVLTEVLLKWKEEETE